MVKHLLKARVKAMMLPRIDLTGRRFGKLVAVKYVGKDGRKNSMWRCACSCGGEKIVKHAHLTAGHTVSCGCRHTEMLIERNKSHGLSKTKLYERYSGMIARCENPKHISYHLYGAIGVKVCHEWRSDFGAFKEWAVKNGYKKNLVLDRINSNGDYSPENCRWVTRTENNQNARPCSGRKYRGIKDYGKRFKAEVYVNKKCINLGAFDTPELAVSARNNYIKANGLAHKIQTIKGA